MTRYFKIDPEQHMIELADVVDDESVERLEILIAMALEDMLASVDYWFKMKGAAVLAGGIGLIEVDGETGQALQAAPPEGD